ncbi:MAG: tetratricopeptide repeat protein [Dolichospermum sp. BR01]|nr:tetratricopeptide repeat protein [Dolichospermum sp. BR01]
MSNKNQNIKQHLQNIGYTIIRQLGKGGFGVTYLAYHQEQPKRKLVIKTIKSDFQDFLNLPSDKIQKTIKMFEDELKILKLFNHPNIVKIENIEIPSTSSGIRLPFIIMEYIEGKTLKQIIEETQGSFLKEEEALNYIRQICNALTVVHNENILHRDINPSNIMVRHSTNEAILIDFGIARYFTPNITESHTIYHTRDYAPPEQLERQQKRGNYTDVYALAATLYHLLTKKTPDDSIARTNTICRDKNDPLVEPKEINSNISDRVNESILWGMKLDKEQRPQTVEDWSRQLFSDEVYYSKKGNHFYKLEDYQNAISSYSKAIESNPNNEIYYKQRGDAHYFLGNYEDAIKNYNQVISNTITDIGFYIKKGDAYCCLKKYLMAILDYNRAIDINPNNADFYIKRGDAYCCLKEYLTANLDYSKAIDINPNNADFYIKRGDVLYCQNYCQSTIVDYSKAIDINSYNADFYIKRGDVYYQLNDYNEAIKDYNKAIDINSNNADFYIKRGDVYYQLNDYDKAIKDYNKAIDINPIKGIFYQKRGNIYYQLNDYNKAIQDYTRAIYFNRNNNVLYQKRGDAYHQLRDYKKAIQDYTRAIYFNRNNNVLYQKRGDAYHHLGDYRNAELDRNKAIEINRVSGTNILRIIL